MTTVEKQIENLNARIANYQSMSIKMAASISKLPDGDVKSIIIDQKTALDAYTTAMQAIVDKYSDGSSSVTA